MRIGVYGLGRFGYFWAGLLAKAGHDVCGFGRHATSVPCGVRLVGEDEALEQDAVFFCVTISAFADVIRRVASKLSPGVTVLDTCSVKLHPAHVMEEYLPDGVFSIATHPMFGPDSGRNGVTGLPLVISGVHCPDVVVRRWSDEFASWGLKVLHMSCDQHDKEAAWSQGVTHFVGRTLDELHLQPTQLATLGYTRLMSIVEQTCNDPIQLFYDLQRYNPYAPQMRLELKQALEKVMSSLAAQDAETETQA
ncbi:MAG: prephenate dehydrogenase/arogenate dehydrogenase family protein [Sphaerochaetaceae bacterium]|jgi:prephenate dehydrogenase